MSVCGLMSKKSSGTLSNSLKHSNCIFLCAQLNWALCSVCPRKSLSYFLIPVLPILFVQELGWSEEGFNATKGGLLVLVLMLGYIVGGQLGKRFGGKSIIIYSTLALVIISIIWGFTEPLWENQMFLVSIWSMHTFCQGMDINIFSLMMKVTWPEVGYAIHGLHGYDEFVSCDWIPL